jgi:hypothetical protein
VEFNVESFRRENGMDGRWGDAVLMVERKGRRLQPEAGGRRMEVCSATVAGKNGGDYCRKVGDDLGRGPVGPKT